MSDAFWPRKDGYFVFPKSLEEIRSDKGSQLADKLSEVRNGMQIFLRGSHLESPQPFNRADVDLFVVYDDEIQLNELRILLPPEDFYDIKLLRRTDQDLNFVYTALLHCRSLQICGNLLERIPIKADALFAWKHWLQYCPSMIPDIIDTGKPTALIHFKLLTRSFGVLSFLKHIEFTRDIDSCIRFAEKEHEQSAHLLKDVRCALESGLPYAADVRTVKNTLFRLFDTYYN